MADSAVGATDRTRPIRVLHVDDEPDFSALAIEFLTREDSDLEIETEARAADALDRLEGEAFDCVVSDYDMPEMDGLALLAAVRERFPRMPFILFTGKGSEEIASDAVSAGVTDYLQKGRGREQYTILANRIRNAVGQYRAQREAAYHRRVSKLARDVMRALVGATSRDEIEQAVCDQLTASEPYRFAWIGRVDTDEERIEPSASAGVDDGYLDEVTITTGDDPRSDGPAGTAVREQRLSVAQNIADDPSFAPWRDRALERGFRSVVAVPLLHDGSVYGVLVVYATRADAFDATECDLLGELGSAVGHAIDVREVRDRLERQYRNLFEAAPVMYALTRDDGGTPIVVDCNQRFLDRLRYDREEIVGAPLANIYTAASADELLDEGGYSRALDGQFTQERRQLLTADGEVIETMLRAVPRYDQHGETVGTLTLFVDTDTPDPGQAVSTYRDARDASNAK